MGIERLRIESYSTVLSAALVATPNDLPVLPGRLVEQEASPPV